MRDVPLNAGGTLYVLTERRCPHCGGRPGETIGLDGFGNEIFVCSECAMDFPYTEP